MMVVERGDGRRRCPMQEVQGGTGSWRSPNHVVKRGTRKRDFLSLGCIVGIGASSCRVASSSSVRGVGPRDLHARLNTRDGERAPS